MRVLGELLAPIGMLRVVFQLLTLPFEKNCVKSDPVEDRSRIVRVSNPVDLLAFKPACKKIGATVTVVIHSIISQALKEYAR